MRVDVYNRAQACELDPQCNTVLVSISTPDINYRRSPEEEGWKALLKFSFHDVSTEVPNMTLMEDRTADILTQLAKNKYDVAVHCDAGISRSVAVGLFLHEQFGYELHMHSIQTTDLHNRYVYTKLLQAMERQS